MTTFKAGDKVKIIAGLAMGRTGVITGQTGSFDPADPMVYVKPDGQPNPGRSDGAYAKFASRLELIEAPAFEPGQKVRVIRDRFAAGYYHGYKKGEIVEILAKRYSDLYDCENVEGTQQLIRVKDLEAVAEFKAGDKVRLISGGDKFPLYGYTNGNVYTIETMPEDHPYHSGKGLIEISKELGGTGFAAPAQLELVVSAPKAEAAAPAHEFKAGDKVVLKNGGGSFPLNGFKNGETYEIKDTAYPHSLGELIQIHQESGYPKTGYARADQLELAKPVEPGEVVELEDLKVGDVFVYADPENELPDYVTAGKEYKVVKIDSFGDPRFVDDDGDEIDVIDDCDVEIRKIRHEEAEKSKEGLAIGDKIVFTYAPQTYVTVGKTYEVDEINDAGYAVFIDDDGDDIDVDAMGRKFVMAADYVAPAAVPPAKEAKRMFLATTDGCDVIKGKMYEIKKIDEDGDVEIVDEAGDEQLMIVTGDKEDRDGQIVTVTFE